MNTVLQLLDANAAVLLCWIGVLLIAVEFCRPGWVWPGVSGGVAFVCGAYRLAGIGVSPFHALCLSLLLILSIAGGYRRWPLWVALTIAMAAGWITFGLVPRSPISTITALASLVSTLLLFVLNRLAGSSAAKKHKLSRLF